MVDQIRKPGVEITQVFAGTPPTPVTASLVPCIVGPAYEVVDLIGDDGAASTESQVSTSAGPLLYTQRPVTILPTELPTPRADSAQMSVLSAEVEVALDRSGAFDILDRNPGTAFLGDMNVATQAGIWVADAHLTQHAASATTLIFLVNTSLSNNADAQVFSSAATTLALYLADILDTIDGIGITPHTYDTVSGQIFYSTRYGASSSISLVSASGGSSSSFFTIKNAAVLPNHGAVGLDFTALNGEGGVLSVVIVGGVTQGNETAAINGDVITIEIETTVSTTAQVKTAVLANASVMARLVGVEVANPALTVAVIAGALLVAPADAPITVTGLNASKVRTEGSGLHAKDNPVAGALTSAFVTHSKGEYEYIAGAGNASVAPADNSAVAYIKSVQIAISGAVEATDLVDSVDFSSVYKVRAATPTSNGDLFTASGPYGQSLSRVMVTEVTDAYLRLGIVDTQRSEYDADGNPTNQRYLDFFVGELNNAVPFVPKNAFVIAQNLTEFNDGNGVSTVGNHVGAVKAIQVATAATAVITFAGANFSAVYSNYTNLAFGVQVITPSGQTTYTITMPDNSDETAVATIMSGLTNNTVAVTANAAGEFTFTTVEKGDGVDLIIADLAGQAGLIAAVTAVPGGSLVDGSTGSDDHIVGLTATELSFTLNQGPRVYSFTATSDSLPNLVTTINNSMGYDAISYTLNVANATFTLTSYLYGIASSVAVVTTDALAIALGLNAGTISVGTGRPNPDVHVTSNGTIHISGDIMRNVITGLPLEGTTGARIHTGYRALRLDLTPAANQPGILKVSDIDDLTSVYGPVSNRNPLALALYYAMVNAAAGYEVNAIGVSAVSDAEPDGTTVAYAEAIEFLRSYEVYSIVPLTSSEDVIALFDAHVTSMSVPTQRAERVVISAPPNPTRRNDYVVLSTGELGAESTGNVDQVDLNDSPEATLGGLGIDTSAAIPFELDNGQQLYLHITIGSTAYRYSVSSVDGARVTVRYAYTTAQNGDGYYDTATLPTEYVAAEFSLALRGTKLVLPGPAELLDKTTFSTTVRDKAQQYLNRRQIRLFPDTIQSSAIGGINQRLPSFYYGAALAGAVSNIESQEPLTRVPMVGFNDVIGPDLERNHLDVISAGNAVIEVEIQGQAPALRMQGTTDPSTIESREWSVTRAVDAFAKTMRTQLKARIGRFNITQAYIDELTLLVDSICTTAIANGQFRSAVVVKLEQDPTQPDTILVEIQLEVLYPANYINVTLVV